ncbi:MAG TPA: AMP-binding protein, partial [Methylomirabilota bacterium]
FHVHGLVGGLLSSLAAGTSVICTPGFNALRFAGWLRDLSPTWYTAVPTMHQAILQRMMRRPGGTPPHHLRFIRSCSAPLGPRLHQELEACFRVPVVQAYGMTEAAHQIASNPLPPGERMPGSVGLPTGTSMAVMDAGGRLLPGGATGEIVIRGPAVMEGYDRNPEANERSLVRGWFRTGDEGYIDAGGYVYLTGRLKEMINRGGQKVSPVEIDGVLADHPAVRQAAAFAVPHVTLGEDVAAAIVLHDGHTASEAELRAYARGRLAAFKTPSRILFVPEIPKGPTGKVQRAGLAGALGLAP